MIWIFLRLFIGYSLQMFPWAFLCCYPFRDHLRLKNDLYVVLTVLIGILGVIFSSICCILKSVLPTTFTLFFCCNLVFFVLLACCVFLYFYTIEGFRANKLFVFFFIATVALCCTSIGNVIFDKICPDMTDYLPYQVQYIFINILITFITYSFSFYIIRYQYMPISQVVSKDVHRFLSIVSSVLFIIFAGSMTFVDRATHRNLASTLLYVSLLLAVIFMYGMLFYLLKIDHKEMLAKDQLLQLDQQLRFNEVQYCRISENIENSRKMRHDLRYHMLTLQGYLNENKIGDARTYIEHYLHTIEQETLHIYSENAIVNYIVSHYHAAARQKDIVFCCPPPEIPKELPIRAADLSVILGNLLENALTAASRVEKGERYINLNILYTAQILVITVDNPFAGEVIKTGDTYISQKPGHPGLGIASITSIAQSYDGGIEFTHEDHIFHASVMLNMTR